MRTVTVKAPVNIAVIKYWGKKDEELIIPLNDSISGTLSMDHLCAMTTVAISDNFSSNRMWLNKEEISIESNQRLLRCIRIVKDLVGTTQWPIDHYVHICSENNFPTAAGLASSAAGYACLVYALCSLFNFNDVERISTLARLGSGSACRSVYGGFVQWIHGTSMETSIAKPIITENDWPEICVLILVVNDRKKDTSSTNGMQLSVQTSELMGERVRTIVPERIKTMIDAINRKDFHQFAELTMKDSNQFHAICQDTYPPIRYMNDTSWSVVRMIHRYNQYYGKNVAAYTFDAGPNACIYCLEPHVPELIALIQKLYYGDESSIPITGLRYERFDSDLIDPKLTEGLIDERVSTSIKYIISTKLGTGPLIVARDVQHGQCLLDEHGMPK